MPKDIPEGKGWNKSIFAPTFRFSEYFLETKSRCRVKRTGLWLEKLDTDTIDELIGVLEDVDKSKGQLSQGSELFKDFYDFCNLCMLLWQWETGKKVPQGIVPDEDEAKKQAEYYYRLASLVQFCYNQRHKVKNPSILAEDNKKYKGKLAIYE